MRIGKLNENSQLISSYEVIGGLINITIKIGESWVSNPTIEQMATLGYMTIVEGSHKEPVDGYYESETFSEVSGVIFSAYELIAIPVNPLGL
jgi:hypothetical protein